jgi:hypothetical protein
MARSNKRNVITAQEIAAFVYWGPSPIRAETYGKEPLRPSTWESCATKRSRVGEMPRDIAQNHGVHAELGAMFADEPAYFAQ